MTSRNNNSFPNKVGNFVPSTPRKRSFPALKNAVAKQAVDERQRSLEFAQQVRMRCEAFLERIIKGSLFLEEIEVVVANYCYDVGRENELLLTIKKVEDVEVVDSTSSEASSSEDDSEIDAEDY